MDTCLPAGKDTPLSFFPCRDFLCKSYIQTSGDAIIKAYGEKISCNADDSRYFQKEEVGHENI